MEKQHCSCRNMAESLVHLVPDVLLERLDSLAQQIPELEIILAELRDLLSALQDLVLVVEGLPRDNRESSKVRNWLLKVRKAMDSGECLVDELQSEVSLRKAAQKTELGSIRRKVGWQLRFSRRKAAESLLELEQEKTAQETMVINNEKRSGGIMEVSRVLKDLLAECRELNLISVRHVKPEMEEGMAQSAVGAPGIIGRDEDKKNIIQLLMRLEDGENVSVLPIVGVGGIGKTTLARSVFDDVEIAERFEIRMWIYVSPNFNIAKMIKEMIHSATGDKCGDSTLDQSQIRLTKLLEGKRYLLILDDVWNTDRQEWLELRAFLMGGATGSKIVVTTRKIGVGPIMGTVQSYVLSSLSNRNSLSLLRENSGRKKISRHYLYKFLKKCRGIPLQIRVLGRLMRFAEGTTKRDDVAVRPECFSALKLSYEMLPPHLKPCFAFCSIFPKNYEFHSGDLVLLWMVHDLITPSHQDSGNLEDTGNEYIKELLARSFFQDHQEREHGACFSFRMHDLVHDLAVSLAHQESVMLTFGAKNIPRKIRRVSFSDEDWSGHEQVVVDFLGKLTSVETIFFPDYGVGLNSESILNTCIERFRSMRVLDLSDSRFKVLPESITSLSDLRFLSLRRNDRIMNLPASISRMRSLQVLLLRGCSQLANLPEDMENFVNLRHLEMTTGEEALSGLNSMKSLRYLEVVGCVNLKSLHGGRESSFIALRTLLIHRCPSLASLPCGIIRLSALKILRIEDCETLDLRDNDDEDDDDDSVPGFLSLRLLVIVKLPRLETLPKWILHAASASNTLERIVIETCPNFRGLSQEVQQNYKSFQKFQFRD